MIIIVIITDNMQTIKIDINRITEGQIDLIVDYLKRGQVIAYPTDTIYGLGCDARNEEAIKAIKKMKGQKDDKPLLVLISDFAMLKQYCVINAEQMEYLKKGWGEHHATPLTPLVRGADQRPVTVILENRQNLPAELTGGLDSLAVRLPKNEFLIKMISKVGFPLVSTSLNKAGQPPLSNLNNLGDYFEILPDLALSVGTIAGAKPSKLVDLRDVKNIKVIRE